MGRVLIPIIALAMTLCANVAISAEETVSMYLTTDSNLTGKKIGTLALKDTEYGLLITPELNDLKPGTHGFHVHQYGSCLHSGKGAGDHLDPEETGKHLGPYGDGHLGDMPVLIVDKSGKASLPILAPRLKLTDIQGRSIIIHEGSDNYSDEPQKLGGGGKRVACTVLPMDRAGPPD
ncbi:MAG: superoxide dismutase [Legionellales bacterium]|nr:superoxide dismutase [Legionellales bacterium]|tara:strand:+ start:7164 stop:7694 length:531 start_codon:yes stop_codon:yes gene_type:complete